MSGVEYMGKKTEIVPRIDPYRLNPEFFKTTGPDLRFSETCNNLRKYQTPTLHCSWQGCHKMLFEQKYLDTHLATHELEKSYICGYEECSQASVRFSNYEELKLHDCKQHGLPFCFMMCPWIFGCKFVTDNAAVLITHLKVHKLDVPLFCPECGFGFETEKQFNSHKRSDSTLPCIISCICKPVTCTEPRIELES